MSTNAEQKTDRASVLVSEDRLKAWLHVPAQAGPPAEPLTLAELREVLTSAKIQLDEAAENRLAQFAAMLATPPTGAGHPEIPEKYLIAEGTPPVEGQDGTIDWAADVVASAPEDANVDHVDYFAQNCIKTVEAGMVVGRISPPTEGAPGCDVYGNPVPPAHRRGNEITLGAGLRLADTGDDIVANAAGHVVARSGTLLLEEVLDIRGDVCFESGSVNVGIDVHVRGTVRSQFHVHTSKSLTVDKAVEAADVIASGDIVVRGGVCGGDAAEAETGRVRAGGTITVRFANEAILEATGAIHFSKECIAGVLRTPDRIISERGTIIGGFVWARNGIEAGTLGSDANVLTYIAVDIRPAILHQARTMEGEARARRESAKTIRTKVQPLMANLKRLTAQQREMATELLSKADEMETGAEDLEARREKLLAEARPTVKPAILVHHGIYRGVRIVWGDREARVTRYIPGPVRVEERKVKGATELVLVNQQTASVTVLHSTEVDMAALPADSVESTGGEHESEQPGPDRTAT
ncbi:MAG: FapA family protein [Phycisphaerae bacterium]